MIIRRKFRNTETRATASLAVKIEDDTYLVALSLPAGMDLHPIYWRNLGRDEARKVWKDQQDRYFAKGWERVA